MNYNEIGKYLEATFGGNEFVVYTARQMKELLETDNPNVGTKIVKTTANMWVKM